MITVPRCFSPLADITKPLLSMLCAFFVERAPTEWCTICTTSANAQRRTWQFQRQCCEKVRSFSFVVQHRDFQGIVRPCPQSCRDLSSRARPEEDPRADGSDQGATDKTAFCSDVRRPRAPRSGPALGLSLRTRRRARVVGAPKGLPVDPKTNHLAVHTEDHPPEYGALRVRSPRASTVAVMWSIWDRGTSTLRSGATEVKVGLHGARAEGRYVLFSTRGKNWMIHRMDPAL